MGVGCRLQRDGGRPAGLWVVGVVRPGVWQPPVEPSRVVSAQARPSVADMLAALRRVLIASQYRPGVLVASTVEEILEVPAAWAAAAA
jgi:hypothetical protein